jgi:hypothetical protein
MTEIKDCLPELARKHFIDLRNIRLEADTGKYMARLIELRAQIAARNQGRSGWQEMEEWKYKEELWDSLAKGYVEDAFETCRLYDIELTRSLCDCLVKATNDLLEIQYRQALQVQGQGLADVKIPISVRQQGNLRSRKVTTQIRVMIEATRVADEKRRMAMKQVPKNRFSVGRRVLKGLGAQPATVTSVAELPSTLGEYIHDVILDAYPDQPQKVLGCDLRAIPPLDADLRGVKQPTVLLQNSSVANLNLGAQVGTINAALQTISGGDAAQQEFVRAIEQLTEAVLQAALPTAEQREVVEALSTIVEQAAKKPGERSKVSLKSLLHYIPTVISGVSGLANLWAKYEPIIKAYFHL